MLCVVATHLIQKQSCEWLRSFWKFVHCKIPLKSYLCPVFILPKRAGKWVIWFRKCTWPWHKASTIPFSFRNWLMQALSLNCSLKYIAKKVDHWTAFGIIVAWHVIYHMNWWLDELKESRARDSNHSNIVMKINHSHWPWLVYWFEREEQFHKGNVATRRLSKDEENG